MNSKNGPQPIAVGGTSAAIQLPFPYPTFVAANLADAPEWCWKTPTALPIGMPRLWYATIQLAREVVFEFEGTRPMILDLPDFALLKEGVQRNASGIVVFPYTLAKMPLLRNVTLGTSYADVAAKVFESELPVYVVYLEPQGYVAQDRFTQGLRIRYEIDLVGRDSTIGGRFGFIGDLCVIPESETKLTVYHRIRLMF